MIVNAYFAVYSFKILCKILDPYIHRKICILWGVKILMNHDILKLWHLQVLVRRAPDIMFTIITASPRGQRVNTADCKWVWQQHLCGCHGDLMLSASGPPSTRKAAMYWLLHIPKCKTWHGILMLQKQWCENVKQSLGRGRGRMGGCWQQSDLKLCIDCFTVLNLVAVRLSAG